MSGLGSTLRGVATGLFTDQFTDLVTITYVTEGVFDASTARTEARTNTTATVNGLIEEYPASEVAGGQTDDPNSIRSGDRKLTVPAAGLATKPQPDDTVTVGSDVWQIKKIDEIPGGPTPVLYVLRIRR